MKKSTTTSPESIIIQGARVNNLKNITVEIPRNKLVVITGLSGSGKSSLAFDTLYAEGQRRYVESLSAYARQFLGRMGKPEVDNIVGISPAIAIEQKSVNRNPRSTVGTSTEIYEYLKLMYARIGHTYSPVSGKEVRRDTVVNVVDFILQLPVNTKVSIFAPLIVKDERTLEQQLSILQQMGFSRIAIAPQKKSTAIEIIKIDDFLKKNIRKSSELLLLIDRLSIQQDDTDLTSRVFDSVQSAYHEGDGMCIIQHQSIDQEIPEISEFSNRFELDGMTFEKPSVNFFSFNNPYGACPTCEGYGNIIGISEDLVIPNPSLSVYEEAVACWKGEKMSEYKKNFIKHAETYDFPIHKPYFKLTAAQKKILWDGTKDFDGIYAFFEWLETQTYKIQYRVMLARYRGKTICPKCNGTRLREDAFYVRINEKSIKDLVLMPVHELVEFFNNLKLSKSEAVVVKRLLDEINRRLQFLLDVGLPYLTLNRNSATLSGGEAQRITLATQLGSSLVGSMYILDEPSVGLHARDTQRLIAVLKRLRDIGNTVIVVEHDEEIMSAADHIIDIGPLAGQHGGEVVFQGTVKDLKNAKNSLTADYMTGKMKIEVPQQRRKWKDFVELDGAIEHNLQNLDVKFPLKALTVVTGVSGSGKTTLVKSTLYPALKKHFGETADFVGKYRELKGDLKLLEDVELVDQNPIGRSSRSNPVTYVKAYDEIRDLFASQPLSKQRNYKPGYFSFNVEGGRCEVCEGEGKIKVEMQFMADVYLTCDECHGKRFKDEVLEIKYRDKNINDVLEMTIDEAIEFFSQDKNSDAAKIIKKLRPLQDVGLGYLHLGQSSSSLSGGEAQRVKLAYFLTKGATDKTTLFIFDEPTTGLHFHDIKKLQQSFSALIELGHTVIVIEHHPDMIKCADWVIDLGPEGGDLGGNIMFEGTPEDLLKQKDSITANAIRNKL